jgi:hypothetical protein
VWLSSGQLLTFRVSFLQRSVTNLKTQANLYWFLTNLVRQSPVTQGTALPLRCRLERRSQKHREGFMRIQSRSTLPISSLSDLVQHLARTLFDPYRPELHYMRGPGPKWHAKHEDSGVEGAAALVRVRVKR